MTGSDRGSGQVVENIAALALMVLLGGMGLAFHEWWRDAACTWLAVRDSTSLPEVMETLGFNGHPHFYYGLSLLLKTVFPSPWSLSVANLLFSVGAAAFLLFSRSFSRWEKGLFVAGFYPLFQYGVVVRPYSLILFFLFGYAWARARMPHRPLVRHGMLAVLAQVHFLSMGLTAVLAGLEALGSFRSRRWSKQQVAGLVLVGLSVLLTLWQLVPDEPASGNLVRGSLLKATRGFASAFWPDYGIFHWSHPWSWFQVAGGLGLWALSWAVFRGHRQALLTYVALTAGLFLMFSVVYGGHRWHHGLYFLGFLAALWMVPLSARPSGWRSGLVTAVLALHAAIGVYALADDALHPYSNGPRVAQAITERGLAGLPITGLEVDEDDHTGAVIYSWDVDLIMPVLFYLEGKKAYDPRAQAHVPCWRHHDDSDYYPDLDLKAMEDELDRVARELGGDMLVVQARSLPRHDFATPGGLELLERFPEPPDYGAHLTLFRYTAR